MSGLTGQSQWQSLMSNQFIDVPGTYQVSNELYVRGYDSVCIIVGTTNFGIASSSDVIGVVPYYSTQIQSQVLSVKLRGYGPAGFIDGATSPITPPSPGGDQNLTTIPKGAYSMLLSPYGPQGWQGIQVNKNMYVLPPRNNIAFAGNQVLFEVPVLNATYMCFEVIKLSDPNNNSIRITLQATVLRRYG